MDIFWGNHNRIQKKAAFKKPVNRYFLSILFTKERNKETAHPGPIREMETTTTPRNNFTPIPTASIKRLQTINLRENLEKSESPLHLRKM